MAGRLLVAACGIQVSDQGLHPGPLHGDEESQPLTTRQVPKTRSSIHTENKDGSRWIKDNMKCKVRKIRSYIYTVE